MIRSGVSNSRRDRGGCPTLNWIISDASDHLGVCQTLHVIKSGLSYVERDYLGGCPTLDVTKSGVSDTSMVGDADILLIDCFRCVDPYI